MSGSPYSSTSQQPEPAIALAAADVAAADRPVPGWWRTAFIATLVLGACYFLYYMPGVPNRGLVAAYDEAVAENLREQFKGLVLQPDRGTILHYMNDPEWLAYGKTLFAGRCAKCHGPEALGLVGPNLRDDAWIHVNKLEDIAAVVTNGANNGAMPAWNSLLHPNEVVFVSAYVASLRGVPGSTSGKPAERNAKVIPPWPAE